MFSVPEEYHRLLVRPAVDRFMHDPTAYDLCFAACTFVFHFCDVVAHEGNVKPEDVRKKLEASNPLINVVHAVCLGAKHVEVTNKKVRYVGFRAEHTDTGSGAAFSDGSYYSDGASHSDAPEVVRAKMPDGKMYDMKHTVMSVTKTIEETFFR